MGAFYTSHTLRGPSRDDLLAWLADRDAFVSTTQRSLTTILDAACESQDVRELADLAKRLSAHFQCPVLAVLNHDDDILYFELYERGEKTDEYNSSPAYFSDDAGGPNEPVGGNANRLAAVFESDDAAAIEFILRKPSSDYVFQTQRHRDLAAALGLPGFSVGVGYNYAQADHATPGIPKGTYVLTPRVKR